LLICEVDSFQRRYKCETGSEHKPVFTRLLPFNIRLMSFVVG